MEESNKQKFTGSVEFFIPKRGFGFIKRDDGKKDIFVFYSDINMEGYKVLNKGDIVTFEEEIRFNDRLVAANVVVVESKVKS